MKKILFPTDFSDVSMNAFVYALELAKKMKATVYTLHVYSEPYIDPHTMPPSFYAYYGDIDIYEMGKFKKQVPFLRDIAEKYSLDEVEMVHLLKPGVVEDVILEVAKTESIDMIVLGTAGANFFQAMLGGSLSGDILENASCPVLVVPKRAKYKGAIQHIGFTTDYKLDEKIALTKVLSLAKKLEAKTYCLHGDLNHLEAFAQRMKTFKKGFEDYDVEFDVVGSVDLAKTIKKYIDDKQLDILAMLTHKRNFWEELVTYSMTKKMSYHLDTPILALHRGDQVK